MNPTGVATTSTGVPGLDTILFGGYPRDRMHLIQGNIGTGKTTLGLSFALAGIEKAESSLYVSLAESEQEILSIAASHGWSAEGLPILHLTSGYRAEEQNQTILHPAEVELPAMIDTVLEHVERAKPERLVIDSFSELRILAREVRWFRRELMRLRDRLALLPTTVLALDSDAVSEDAASLIGSSIRLERTVPDYGPDRRRLHVAKMRGHEYQTGYHDLRIRRGGIFVYPRLVAAEHRHSFEPATCSTGIEAFDTMLGGGLDRGAAALWLGPAGSGKSTLALKCLVTAAERNERGLVYVFNERLQTLVQRAGSLGMEIQEHVDAGRIVIRQVDPVELTPGEFAETVRQAVDHEGIEFVLIDSLNAYLYAMPNERRLNVHLHELLAYLSQHSVTSLLVGSQQDSMNPWSGVEAIDVSYLADTVIFHRILDQADEHKRALVVAKRRAGAHESSWRELRFAAGEIRVGEVVAGHDATSSP